jgi:hypothetical protein
MGVRTGSAVAATTLLICTACGNSLADLAPTTGPEPVPAGTSGQVEKPYSSPSPELKILAENYVRATCAYDSSKEDASDFIGRTGRLSTTKEAARLSTSPRARLNWQALRARHERTRITVTGVTQIANPSEVQLAVEFMRTTTTDFATVREFDRMTLTIVDTSNGPRVSEAQGGGL